MAFLRGFLVFLREIEEAPFQHRNDYNFNMLFLVNICGHANEGECH